MKPVIQIEVWADIVCPWCYIGKRHLEEAIAQFDGDVEITWRSFELDPGMPSDVNKPLDEILSRKYRVTIEQARGMQQRVTDTASDAGICMNFDVAKTGNTFDAHRLIHLARAVGKGEVMTERLMSAYFTEGIAISDREALVELAVECGLEEDTARDALASGAFGGEVREDEAQALEYGVHGVPFFLVDGTMGISGAQPAEIILDVLNKTGTS